MSTSSNTYMNNTGTRLPLQRRNISVRLITDLTLELFSERLQKTGHYSLGVPNIFIHPSNGSFEVGLTFENHQCQAMLYRGHFVKNTTPFGLAETIITSGEAALFKTLDEAVQSHGSSRIISVTPLIETEIVNTKHRQHSRTLDLTLKLASAVLSSEERVEPFTSPNYMSRTAELLNLKPELAFEPEKVILLTRLSDVLPLNELVSLADLPLLYLETALQDRDMVNHYRFITTPNNNQGWLRFQRTKKFID